MRYVYSTKTLLSILRSDAREPNAASPFRALCALDETVEPIPLTDPLRLLCAFALTPEQTVCVGRHSATDGPLYILRIGAVYYLYAFFEGRDQHVFEAYFDRPQLIKFLDRNFCSYYRPNFGAFTQTEITLSHDEYILWNFVRALHAARAQNGEGSNDPFVADDLKSPDLALYLRNYLDETGFRTLSDRIDRLMDEANHEHLEAALSGLTARGVLAEDLLPGAERECAYRLTRTALERMDDGMLTDTVWFCDRTDPQKRREFLLCLRRDGVLAILPKKNGVSLRSFPEVPWEELI